MYGRYPSANPQPYASLSQPPAPPAGATPAFHRFLKVPKHPNVLTYLNIPNHPIVQKFHNYPKVQTVPMYASVHIMQARRPCRIAVYAPLQVMLGCIFCHSALYGRQQRMRVCRVCNRAGVAVVQYML